MFNQKTRTKSGTLHGSEVFFGRPKRRNIVIQNVLYLSMAALKKPPYLREARFVTASETSMIDGTVGFWHAAWPRQFDSKCSLSRARWGGTWESERARESKRERQRVWDVRERERARARERDGLNEVLTFNRITILTAGLF